MHCVTVQGTCGLEERAIMRDILISALLFLTLYHHRLRKWETSAETDSFYCFHLYTIVSSLGKTMEILQVLSKQQIKTDYRQMLSPLISTFLAL